MTRRTRRILFWLAVAFFVAATPLIVSYARGYRLDLSGLGLSRVGAIALETKPKEAAVWLNKKKFSKSTPTVIRNLFPEKIYELRVERDGFWPWEKELEVEAELVTTARNIILFPREFKFAFVATDTPALGDFSLSPNAERVLGHETSGKVSIIELAANKRTPLVFGDSAPAAEIRNVHWSENGNRVLFSRLTHLGERWYAADTDGKVTRLNVAGARFADADGSKVITLANGRITAINLNNGTISEPVVEDAKTFDLRSGRLVIFKNPDIILIAKPSGEEITLWGNLRFVPQNILISPDGKKVAFWHNWHIGVMWLEDSTDGLFRKRGEQDIIFSALSPIKRVRWHASSEHLMAQLENGEFVVAELDGRGEKHNTWTWDLPGISSFDYAAAKEELWFLNQDRVLLRHENDF